MLIYYKEAPSRGILSADLYKIYIDPLLKQLQQSRLGMNIGYIECGATACADDITLNCTDPTESCSI